jgi:hypothetical protein
MSGTTPPTDEAWKATREEVERALLPFARRSARPMSGDRIHERWLLRES